MDLTKAMELFEELKRRIHKRGNYLKESEYRTRILLVDPLLRLLGWNVEDFCCVEIEYKTTQSTNERADYVLKKGESKVAIVEAKKLGFPMGSKERRQAKEYADYAGVSRCMLTNSAKWMLYDLNQGRNPDTMQPWIEFDIENHGPEQLILYSLTLWQQWFTPEVGSSPVSNLFFDSGVDNTQSTNSVTNEQQEQELPNDSPEDSSNWCSFERKLPPQNTKPIKLKIEDRPEETVMSWQNAIHKVVAWLADEETLSINHCPIGTKTYTFIGREAVNPNGTPFENPQQLSNSLILNRGGPGTRTQWRKLRELLRQFDVDLSTIRVFYRSS